MSDNWIVLIPENPRFVPDAAKQRRARNWFAEFAHGADKIEIKVSDRIELFDCGANLERICCPSCRSVISHEWWQDRMEEDFGEGFQLARCATPCCGAPVTLNDLVYDWPQGFGRFAIEAMCSNIGRLDDSSIRELEQIFGTKLRVVYQHI